MLRNAGKDAPASPETKQLLAGHAHDDEPSSYMGLLPDERCQGDVSSSRLTPQDKFTGLEHSAQIGETSSSPVDAITSPSVIANSNQNNDDPPPYGAIPPPYSAIAPPNHAGWPYGLFSFSDLYPADNTTCRVDIPLTPFRATLPATTFHPEGTNCQHTSLPMPLTAYRFFKFGCRRNSLMSREASLSESGLAEKIDDAKSRRYGAILAAAAVIIFLMALSLVVRFVMERSWWRGK